MNQAKNNRISILSGVVIVFLYGLTMATYFDIVNKVIVSSQGIENSIYYYFSYFNYFTTLIIVFSVWLVSSFLFHLFTYLFVGNYEVDFKIFLKYTGLLYFFPTIGFIISIYLFSKITLPHEKVLDFLANNRVMFLISCIINASSLLSFILIVPIIRKIYKTGWLLSFCSVATPLILLFFVTKLLSVF